MRPELLNALTLAENLPATAGSIDRVGLACTPEASRWAFEQWQLRKRATAKFELADQMLFDREGLAMATHERIAAYHASRFPVGVEVADLTCGIGSDLIALARRGPAVGYELDPIRADYARHNLAVHGLAARVIHGDGLETTSAYVFCDPARRRDGNRTLNLDEFAPKPRLVAERFKASKLIGLKLSPMLSDRDLDGFGGAVEFISFGNECREAVVWIGEPCGHSAVHLESGSRLGSTAEPHRRQSPLRYVAEADPAAIRAHSLGSFRLDSLGDSNGYLTSDALLASPWLTWFEVLACHGADVKRTRAELRRLGGGTPIVKVRGVKLNVERMQQDFRGEGKELILMIFPVGKSLRHLIARRLS